MNHFYAYVRVSTARQGEGVSLQEQRSAIEGYAQRHNLHVTRWFEELETAAKSGRPVFSEMVKLLRRGAASGIIIHKIDRSARNYGDWADLGDLIDAGIDVHFANEGLDLKTRGGRLSADIQAVVATDYIRNLREETIKGLWGRFKQGLFPLPAPLGYLNNGAGKPKTLDPKTAPLIQKAFELYSTRHHNLASLCAELNRLGLRYRNGSQIKRTGLAWLLKNPFYIGLIHIKTTNETFQGIHEPLVNRPLFDRVQNILQRKSNTQALKHDFLYRRRLTCKTCTHSLIGETHKHHVYYRCQTSTCPVTCVREEIVNQAVLGQMARLTFSKDEHAWFRHKLSQMRLHKVEENETLVNGINLQTAQADDRLNRLTDA